MRAMLRVAVVVTTCLCIPQIVEAQNFSATGGYSLVRDHAIDETLSGWLASVSGRIFSAFGITAEADRTSKALPVLGTALKYRSLSLMAGPYVSVRPVSRVTLFGQVLFGGIRSEVGILDQMQSRNDFALQPGGGADFSISRTVGIRAGGDYRRINAADSVMTQMRVHAGLVIGSGR